MINSQRFTLEQHKLMGHDLNEVISVLTALTCRLCRTYQQLSDPALAALSAVLDLRMRLCDIARKEHPKLPHGRLTAAYFPDRDRWCVRVGRRTARQQAKKKAKARA